MPRFPRREAEVIALADAMIAGYTANPADFPNADVPALQAVRDTYQTSRDEQTESMGRTQLKTDVKEEDLDDLVEFMKNQLKQSDVDTAADPEKLGLIGWGPKAPGQPSNPPGQPRALDPIIQGPGTLFLDWKQPAPGVGGTVRSYIIERRNEPADGGAFGAWAQVGVALESELTLIGQPRGRQLEYRVIAINSGGQSVPSNTAAVVL